MYDPVLGHHPVTVTLAASHMWARVVNKNLDRQTHTESPIGT